MAGARPQDSGHGPGPEVTAYGPPDKARALQAAARAGAAAFCASVDVAAHDPPRRLCPPQRCPVLADVADLPQPLVAVYRRCTVG